MAGIVNENSTQSTKSSSSSVADEVEIISWDEKYRDDWRDLNLEWIEKYFKVEEPDRISLNHPEDYVLAKGGYIFFARLNDKIVGTCAIYKKGGEVFELAKMAVSPTHQGKQIGKKLCSHAINFARQQGSKEVYLESNTVLTPAIELYKRVGFKQVPMSPSPYSRANIRMSLTF